MHNHQPAGFPQKVSVALASLKARLQCSYEQTYPDLGEIIHLVLNEEESAARKLSQFPHLLLPDLVEAHVARLNLQPPDVLCPPDSLPHDLRIPQLVFA